MIQVWNVPFACFSRMQPDGMEAAEIFLYSARMLCRLNANVEHSVECRRLGCF